MSKKKPVSASFRAVCSGRFVAKLCSACMKYRLFYDAEDKPIFACDHFGDIPRPYLDCQSYDCPQFDPRKSSVTYDDVCQKRLEQLGHK